ncbi:hypothetical protein Adi01nite_28410 [Amorphoplanes digitatis]|nr:hypothetical protein GCM10020092_089900 [Actinoplanes digitatis]GID93429.1 hypothetical protein Adi01nite_28410 [Actinoplanes digitatis]
MHGDYQVFLGLDVGKDGHHAVALTRDGERLHDAPLVNTEAKLRQVYDSSPATVRCWWWSSSPPSLGPVDCSSVTRWRARSRGCLMHTLLPRS